MENLKISLLFALVAFLILSTGFVQSWNTALLILNMGLISAIMSLGVNLQWGFAGLFTGGVELYGKFFLSCLKFCGGLLFELWFLSFA